MPGCSTPSSAAPEPSTSAGSTAQADGFVDGVEHAALDPFRGYANAIRDELPDAVAVLDAFHVVRLGTQVVDEVRRRVQQDTLGRRGHKDDPLYKIRGLLRPAWSTSPNASRPRSAAASTPATRTARSTSPGSATNSSARSTTPPRRRAARSPRRSSTASTPAQSPRSPGSAGPCAPGEHQVLAYFDTGGVSNGGTEAINLIIEKIRRLAHGFRDFTTTGYGSCSPPTAPGPTETDPTHA